METDFHRKVVITKVLRDRHPGAELSRYMADAEAILAALPTADVAAELHEMPATLLSVEQQIRLGVAGMMVADTDDFGTDTIAFARRLADIADPIVAWVATGAVPSEPTGASE